MSPRPVAEVLRAFLVITAVTVMLTTSARLAPLAGLLGDYVPLVVGALFLLSAVQLSQRQPDGLARYGLELGGLLAAPAEPPQGPLATARDLASAALLALRVGVRELAVAVGVALCVFPPFAFGFFLFHAPSRQFSFQLPDDLGAYLLTQLIVVAIPEEALFRGYFQGRLNDRFAARVRLLGAEVAPASLLLQAALFALMHFAVDLNPGRLAVFFPALLFAWLRELRGGIGAAAALHALCNLYSDVLARSWL